jgi:hypothetical protein
MELLLYRECKRLHITYITICHRPSLRIWHTHCLTLLGDGKGGYEFGTIEHTKAEQQAIDEQVKRSKSGSDATTETTAATKSYAAALENRSRPYATASHADAKPGARQSGIATIMRLLRICLPGSEWRLGAFAVGILLRTAAHEMYAYAVGRLFGAAVAANSSLFFRYVVD